MANPYAVTEADLQAQNGQPVTLPVVSQPGQYAVTPAEADQLSSTPDQPAKVYDLSGSVQETQQNYFDYYAKSLQQGMKGPVNAWGGFKAFLGLISPDQLRTEYGDTADDNRTQAQIQAFEDAHKYDIFQWLGPVLKSAPSMLTVAGGGVAGGLIGGFLGGGAGAAGGPAAEVTVPAGAVAGAELGQKLGQFAVGTGFYTGDVYRDLLLKGADPQSAKLTALGVGMTQALAETVELHQFGALGAKAMAGEFKTAAGKTVWAAAFKEVGKTVGKEIGEEEAQELTQIAGEFFQSVADINSDIIPKWDGQGGIKDRLNQTFWDTLKASTLISGAGVSLSALSKAKGKQKEMPTSLTQALKQGAETWKEAQKAAAAKEAEKLIPPEVLNDAKAIQAGKPLEGRVETTVVDMGALKDAVSHAEEMRREAVDNLYAVGSLSKSGKLSSRAQLSEAQRQALDRVEQANKVLSEAQRALSEAQMNASIHGQIGLRDGFDYNDLPRTTKERLHGEWQVRKEEIEQQGEVLAKESLGAIQAENPVSLDPAAEAKRDTPIKMLKRLGHTIFSWEGKLAIVFQDMKDYTQLIKKLGVAKTVREVQHQKRKQMGTMRKVLMEATGKKEKDLIKLIVKGASSRRGDLIYLTDDKRAVSQTPTEIAFTRNEAIQLWVQMHDETLHKGLIQNNGYSLQQEGDSTYNALAQELTTDEKNLAAGLLNWYKKYFKRLADEYYKETGEELPQVENYSGIAYRVGFKNEFIDEKFHAELQALAKYKPNDKTAGKTKSTIERTDNNLALEKRDAFMNAVMHISQTEHWKAWREPSKILNAVFANHDVKRAIEHKYGKAMLTAIEKHLTDMVKGVQIKESEWMNTANKILGNAGFAFLAAKPQQYVKQWTSLINFALKIPLPELVAGMADYWTDPVGHTKILMRSKLFQDRYASLDKTWLGAIRTEDVSALQKNSLKELLLSPLKYGDMHVSVVGGWAVYRYTLKQTNSKKAALEAFENAFNTTQSSGTVDQLSNLARDPNGRFLSIFLQQPMRMMEYQITAWRDFINHPTIENGYNAWRTTAIVHVAQAAFASVALAWLHMTGAEDEDKNKAAWSVFREFLLGPSIPLASDLASTAFVNLSNTVFANPDVAAAFAEYGITHERQDPYELKSIPLDVLNRGSQFIGRAMKAISEQIEGQPISQDDVFKMMLDYSRSINLIYGALPIEQPLKYLRDYFKHEDVFGGDMWDDVPQQKKHKTNTHHHANISTEFQL